MKKIVICALIALMVIPFALLASSDVAVPAEPTLTSDVVLYASITKGTADGGSTPDAPIYIIDEAKKLAMFNGALKDGGKVVFVSKGYMGGKAITLPATTSPVMFTAFDGTTDYTSRDVNGDPDFMTPSGGHGGQLGMYFAGYDVTFNCDIIFKDIVILNRQGKGSTTELKMNVNKSIVIDKSVTFAEMQAKKGYVLNVAEGAYAYLHADLGGFDNYTGKGTIVVGDEVKASATPATFANFEGKVVDESGKELFEAGDVTTSAPETTAPETEYIPGDTTPVELPAKPEYTGDNKIYVAHDKYPKNPLKGSDTANFITASTAGGATAAQPLKTAGATGWQAVMDKIADGAVFVVTGKGFFEDNAFPATNAPIVFTSRDGSVSYMSVDENGNPYFMNAEGKNAGQYGMFMLKENAVVSFDCDVIFDDIVLLGRLSATGVAGGHSEGTIVVKKRLWVKDNVGFEVMSGKVNHILEVEAGGVAFLDAAGFTGYKGEGTIVLGDAIKDKFTPADFAGFKGKVVDGTGKVIFSFVEDPNAPIVIPARPVYGDENKLFIAHDHNPERDIQGSATGGQYATVPYMTVKGWTKVSNWLKENKGGTLVVVGKGYIGADFAFPATDEPLVFTAKNGGVSYISRNENGSLKYMNEKGGNDGQYGMFIIGEAKKITFNGDVVFKDIVILSRQSKASYQKGTKPATLIVKKSITVENSVQFANMTAGRNYILQVEDGAYAYLDKVGFFNYTGKGTIVIGDSIKNYVTAEMFGGFKGKVVDSQGVELFETIPDNPPTGDAFNPAFVAIIAVAALTMGAVLTFGLKKSR